MSKSFAKTLMAMLIGVAVASALKCYVCKGVQCNYLNDASLLQECYLENQTMCLKFGDEENRYHGCAEGGSTPEDACSPKGVQLENCESCASDGCNCSGGALPSAALVAASAIFIQMYNSKIDHLCN